MERERLLWVQQNYVRPETISAANVRLVEFHTLETLRALGREVKPEDVERLSPLGHDHINYLGKYSFALD